MTGAARLGSSFRDPSGFVFRRGGRLLRQVNRPYEADWQALLASGLVDKLTAARLLIPHREVSLEQAATPDAIALLEPDLVPFVSYPYEWCFSQLKDAALTTLEIQRRAIERGMSLKDASAYNVQFLAARPIFIDSLSFERYEEGAPWVAYGQFCRHFLAPLALMALVDVRLGQLLRVHLDGIPLDLAARLLPGTSKLKPGLLAHIHVHARAQRGDSDKGGTAVSKSPRVSKTALLALVDSLQSVVRGLQWEPKATEWADYYADTNYSDRAMQEKRRLVEELIHAAEPGGRTCWDLGANTGEFAAIAVGHGYDALAIDGDAAAVEKAYLAARGQTEPSPLPLLVDLANPSPALGWASAERESLIERGPAGLVLGLALVHHLAIGNNVPLPRLAEFFAEIGEFVICEFAPKSDSQVQRLLRSREDIFDDYSEDGFERAMAERFDIVRKEPIADTQRTLYLMRKQ